MYDAVPHGTMGEMEDHNLSGSYELGPIRPPSEAYSLLVRVTRNCPWNRCRFCSIYKGSKFELRGVPEIKHDISAAGDIYQQIRETAWRNGYGGRLSEAAASAYRSAKNDAVRNVALWLWAGGESAFLQDANSLIMRTNDLSDVIRCLKQSFPSLQRITSYARSHTAARKSLDELATLKSAGLSRVHIGLESGSDVVLKYVDKGVTAEQHVVGGRRVVESGISLSEYVMPGLGGKKWRREHAVETARVLNYIGPDFIRLRSLVVTGGMPLYASLMSGDFELPSEDEMVEEIGWLIEGLTAGQLVSDHMLNLLPELEGNLAEDKGNLLAIVGRYLSLPERERLQFQLGRRAGYYQVLSDMANPEMREQAERIMSELAARGAGSVERTLRRFRSTFI